MAVGAVVARILTQYSDKGSKAATKDIAKLGKSFDNFAKKSAKAFGLAAAATAAFAIKVGKDAVQAAIADQKSQTLLANSLRNTAGASNEAISGVENYITSLQKQFSVVDDDLRPAMARLTAATGSITAAQGLMQTALDVSASSGADLGTAVGAIIKATSGQFKALKTLVPSLSNATIKSKNFSKALEEVNKATAGSAANRAGTLEYRLAGLRIAFGEILETLGYALLPVIEKFATTISTKVLPQLEVWIATNKERLAASFQVATDFAIKLLTVAIAFGDWVSNNMGLVKTMGVLIVGMFAIGRIAAFIKAIQGVIAVMTVLRTTSIGAAIATAFATSGASIALGAAALATVGIGAYALNEKLSSTTNSGSGGTKATKRGSRVQKNFSPDVTGAPSIVVPGVNTDLAEYLKSLNGNTTAIKKNTKTVMDIATENAMKELAARQKALSGSASIAIGGGGKIYGTRNNAGKIEVNVNAGNVVGSPDALIQAVETGLATARRRNGGGGNRYELMQIV